MTAAGSADIRGLDTLSPAEQQGVGEVMGRLSRGFAARDADVLDGLYAADADWVNAFGTARTGNDEIVAYLRGLFADANFDRGRPAGPPSLAFRRVGDAAVVVSVHLRILGQGLADGGEIPVRDNFSLHVLGRRNDGRWIVESEIYSDANDTTTYREASA